MNLIQRLDRAQKYFAPHKHLELVGKAAAEIIRLRSVLKQISISQDPVEMVGLAQQALDAKNITDQETIKKPPGCPSG